MKKKILSLLLVGAMSIGLVACGGSDTNTGSDGQATDSTGQSEANGEIFTIKMQIVTFGGEFTGLDSVEEHINAIIEPEIGANVELQPVAAWDLPTTSSLAISSNEEIDLMCILPMGSNMDSVTNYTSSNMLMELNDLYAGYGQDIASCLGDMIDVGYIGDTLYAVPANYYAGNGSSFVVLTSALEELGVSYDENTIYTLSDIEDLMADYKAAKGDGFYPIAGYADSDITSYLVPTDDLGGTYAGSLMEAGLGDTTVVNKYESDEFADAYNTIRSWYTQGYINPDVISITDTWTNLLGTGQYLGAFVGTNGSGLDGILVNEQSIGEDLTVIRFTEDCATTSVASYGLWAIPVTCSNPEKTMEFLNILYQDRELENNVAALLSAGVEGETFQVLENLGGGRAIIDYVEGIDRLSAPYAGQVPIYGNELATPKYTPIDAAMYDEITNYNSTIDYSKAFGYTFDAANYSQQLAAINAVLETYSTQLAWGTVEVDTVLPQFLSELESAGINELVEANQTQLNDWLALQ